MSVAAYISGIETSRNTIRNKLIELGLAQSPDKLEKLATAIDSIINQGAVSATVQEGETYTIPAGYHNGSGTVAGVSGGGNYTLQAKSVTPTKKQQSISSDAGFYGLSSVTVEAIPAAYQDVSSVTATAADVLTGKVIVLPDGTVVPGEMLNHGAVNASLSGTVISYTIPKGFHSGSGTVKITLENKTVTPSKSQQKITASEGKVLGEITVGAIPDEYQDVTGVTATEGHVLAGDKFVDATGTLRDGSMPNNGAISKTIDGLTTTSASIPAGYTSGGSVSLTNDIENALAAI